MRYWLDCEFVDDGRTIDLISIALVAEDGREFYRQSVEFDPAKVSDWVREHVLSNLKTCDKWGKWNLDISLYSWRQCGKPDCPWRTREQIRDEIRAFVGDDKPEFWGDYAAYDWVALCQLFGPMIDIPSNWPCFIRDIQQEFARFGIPERPLPKQEGTAHNALSDARYIKRLWEWLQGGQA